MLHHFYTYTRVLILATIILGMPANAASPHNLPNQQVWWKDSFDAAIEASRTQKKPLFIYWGATWCPPCNEIKKEIFSQEKFPAAVEGFIPVALDGDSDQAQMWGERFGAVGYPTILILDSEQQVRLRILGAISWKSFEAALTAVNQTPAALLPTLQKLSRGEQLSPTEWSLISWSDWENLEAAQLSNQLPLALALNILQKIPETMKAERSRLANFILSNAESAPDEIAATIRNRWNDLFTLVTDHDQALQIAAAFLTENVSTLKWSFTPDLTPDTQRARVASWSKALDSLEKVAPDSDTYKIKVLVARCAIWQLSPNGDEAKSSLRSSLDKLSKKIANGKDPYLKKSLLPGLADGYDSLGDQKEAINLLRRAAYTSDTPWYFYSHIAWLVGHGGDKNKAVEWSEKAMNAAMGSATKLQWTFGYIKTLNQSDLKNKDAKLARALGIFYDLAVKNPDAFFNRNKRYMNQAAEITKGLIETNKSLSKSVDAARTRCAKLKNQDSATLCVEYFSRIRPEATVAPTEKGT